MKRLILATALMAVGLAASAADITFYEGEGFQGQRVVITGSVANLANTGFNDRASSVIVRDGAWEVCEHANYGGACVMLQPGKYRSLREAGLDNRISSARQLQTLGPPQAQRRGARAVLYAAPDLQGPGFAIDSSVVTDLRATDFNDRAQSLTVERGYWIFCSEPDFQGECRTFGPGNYPNLSWTREHRIASGRRISNQYPYNTAANWGRADAAALR